MPYHFPTGRSANVEASGSGASLIVGGKLRTPTFSSKNFSGTIALERYPTELYMDLVVIMINIYRIPQASFASRR